MGYQINHVDQSRKARLTTRLLSDLGRLLGRLDAIRSAPRRTRARSFATAPLRIKPIGSEQGRYFILNLREDHL